MSKKFTGITSAGSAIPVYDKDAHSALQNKADVSALTAYQEKGDYYSASNPSGFLTAVPEGYATTGDLEDLSTAIAETFQPQSAMTAYLTAVPEGYATTGDVESAISGKQDISGMSAYQSRGDMSSYASKAFVNENYYSKTLSDNRYQAQSSMSAYQPVGEYYSASNPSGFITGVDLTPYQEKSAMTAFQTIEGMSAYQPSGDYQAAGDYLSASESANFYPMTGNPSGFLTEHQSLDGLMQTSGLEYDGDKISGYMGSAFKAGDELPSGVMVESAVGYNAVNEISGYNGSAIAQYGAEKQWLVHDDTLVHAANSAQYALGVNLSAVAQLLGVDETVLYSATPKNYGGESSGESITLNESISSFERLRFYINVMKGQNSPMYYETYEVDNYLGSACNFQYGPYPENNVTANWFILRAWVTDNICNVSATYNASTSVQNPAWNNKWFPGSLYKVVGIGRKEV